MQRTTIETHLIQSVSMPNSFPTKFCYKAGNSIQRPGGDKNLKRKISSNSDSICPYDAIMSLPSNIDAENEKDKMKFMCMQARLGYVLFRLLGAAKIEEYGYPDKPIIEILNIVLKKANIEVTEEKTYGKVNGEHCDILHFDKKQSGHRIIRTRIDVLKANISKLLRICVPDQSKWTEFGWDGKTIDDILDDLSTGFVANYCSDMPKRLKLTHESKR